MTFREVSAIPKTEYRRPSNDLVSAMEEFMKMNIKYAQVKFTALEFESCYVAGSMLSRCVKNVALPIEVRVRNSMVYLERTDM